MSGRERPSGPPRPSASGLTAFELAMLRVVEDAGAGAGDAHVPTAEVLARLEAATGVGPRYAYPLLCDLTRSWVRHVPLLEGYGNLGSVSDDEPAEPRYTAVRLAPAGELALRSERGEVGPLPLELVEGSLHRGGDLPPFDPATTIRALLVGTSGSGLPTTPTGTITRDPNGAFERGGRAYERYLLGSVIRTGPEPRELVLTSPPYRVGTDRIVHHLKDRVENENRNARADAEDHPWRRRRPLVPGRPSPVRDVLDVSDRWGTLIKIRLADGVDPVDGLDWVRSVWPVTTYVDCAAYEDVYDRFVSWRGLDQSGLHALESLLTRGPAGDEGNPGD